MNLKAQDPFHPSGVSGPLWGPARPAAAGDSSRSGGSARWPPPPSPGTTSGAGRSPPAAAGPQRRGRSPATPNAAQVRFWEET